MKAEARARAVSRGAARGFCAGELSHHRELRIAVRDRRWPVAAKHLPGVVLTDLDLVNGTPLGACTSNNPRAPFHD